MRIAYVVTSLGLGGTEKWVCVAAEALAKSGHEVAVLADGPPHIRGPQLISCGVAVHAFERPCSDVDAREVFRRFSPDIIHVNVWARASEWITRAAPLTRAVVWGHHFGVIHRWPGWLWRSKVRVYGPRIGRDLLRMSEMVAAHVACSEATAQALRRLFGARAAGKVFAVRNAIELPTPNDAQVLAGDVHFLQAGALDRNKRPAMTLRAFARVLQVCPTARLTFAGDGPLRRELEDMVRNEQMNGVEFLGYVEDMQPVFARCNVVVMPSLREGLGYVLVEGAGRGMALIGTQAGGMREVLKPGITGMAVATDDWRALARGMCTLASDASLRMRLGSNGRRLVATEFSLAKFVQDLERVYARCLERDPSSRAESAAGA